MVVVKWRHRTKCGRLRHQMSEAHDVKLDAVLLRTYHMVIRRAYPSATTAPPFLNLDITEAASSITSKLVTSTMASMTTSR